MRLTALVAVLLLLGCRGADAPDAGSTPARPVASAASAPPVVDAAYLTQDLWNDGEAEVAFYEVERSRNQYGRPDDQRFVVGTYLVKHDFSPEAMSKAVDGPGVPAFKYALFYEIESGTYQYKRNWVVNARQRDLAPLKQSFSSFDWCSNLYRELAFQPDGRVETLVRSDDYGNEAATFDARAGAYPVALLPLLVRGLDASAGTAHPFEVVLLDGTHVGAEARFAGRETVETPAGPVEAERIEVSYDAPVPSMIAETSDAREVYWRALDDARTLVKVEGAESGYTMTLVEALRSPYWEEDIFPMLRRVSERP